jgi:tetratricopeptide (TPR) repeat protein
LGCPFLQKQVSFSKYSREQKKMPNFNEALKLLDRKDFEKARDILEELLIETPDDVNILYNLGMCYSEMNHPTKAIELLNRCVELAPSHSNAYVALGFAFTKIGNPSKAKDFFLKAIEINPDNSYALKNLGGIWGKLGNHIKALYYLRKSLDSNPDDPYTAFGLGITYRELGDMENADKYLKRALEMKAPVDLQRLAKDELRDIAVKSLKAKGFRADAVFYCLAALELFKKKTREEIQSIAFEIALKGQSGLDINNPDKKYQLISLRGNFTGLQLVCYMYVGFKQIAPEQDVGIDLSEEYRAALNLTDKETTKWHWN